MEAETFNLSQNIDIKVRTNMFSKTGRTNLISATYKGRLLRDLPNVAN
jgi:hypothetical protein